MAIYSAVYERDGDWWIGHVEEVPGAHTQGRTLDEARENLKEAVELMLEVNRELAHEADSLTEIIREPLVVGAE